MFAIGGLMIIALILAAVAVSRAALFRGAGDAALCVAVRGRTFRVARGLGLHGCGPSGPVRFAF